MSMTESEVVKTIRTFSRNLPKFSDGRIDYSHSQTALVVCIFVKDRVLLLKRSDKVSSYKGLWNAVTGFLDKPCPLRNKILEELEEEIGVNEGGILSIHIGISHKVEDNKRIWIVYPALVELKNLPEIRLNWEHAEYKWIKPNEFKNFNIVPKLDKSFENAIKNIN